MTEEMLKQDFIKYLESEGCEVWASEFGASGSFIHDLVYLDKQRKFVCVELKLTDWKKVIEQAMRIKKWTPLVYIAMPLPATIQKRNKIEQMVKELELGLFWFKKDETWNLACEPIQSIPQTDKWLDTYFERVHLEKPIFHHYLFTFIAPHLGRAALLSRNVEYKDKKVIW